MASIDVASPEKETATAAVKEEDPVNNEPDGAPTQKRRKVRVYTKRSRTTTEKIR